MALPDDFVKDATQRTKRCVNRWYSKNLMRVLYDAKEKHARDIDVSIAIGKKLVAKLNEKVDQPVVVPPRPVPISDNTDLMKPIEPEVLDILYKSTEYGGDVRYLNKRYKKPPEERFYFRAVTSWDYGWQQKASKLLGRDKYFGREAILKHTFYRNRDCGPDPKHYGQPAGADFSVCGQYSCNAN